MRHNFSSASSAAGDRPCAVKTTLQCVVTTAAAAPASPFALTLHYNLRPAPKSSLQSATFLPCTWTAKPGSGGFRGIEQNFPVYELAFERFNYAVTQHKRIFGTDGVRGVANVEPVTAETSLKLGRAAAHVFTQLNPRRNPEGTRPKIVLGKDTRLSGYMLDDQVEQQIEQLVFAGEIDSIRPTAGKIGRAARIDDALGRYVEFVKASFPRGMSLEEMRVAVDVANGAAYKSTPCVLRELGADVAVAHNQ